MRRRHVSWVFAAVTGAAVTVVATDLERRRSVETRRAELERGADVQAEVLQNHLAARELVATAFAGLFSASDHADAPEPAERVTPRDLRAFFERAAAGARSVIAVSWNRRTRPDEAPAVAAQLRALGVPEPVLRTANGEKIDPAALAREVFPVTLIEPAEGNAQVLGLDTATFPDRQAAFSLARDTAKVVVTQPVALVQSPGMAGVVAYAPVYGRIGGGDLLQARREALRGFVAVVFRLDRVIADAFRGGRAPAAHLHVFYRPTRESALHLATVAAANGTPSAEAARMLDDPAAVRRSVVFGLREWTMVVEPAPTPTALLDGNVLWTLGIGLLLTMLAAGYLFSVDRSAALLDAEVEARRKAEAEKDLLIREVNHRVKNSLQLVTSLLAIQRRQTADPAARRDLEEASGRVKAIARVHERLYRDAVPGRVDLCGYLRDLCEDLRETAPEYVCRVQGPTIEVPADAAVKIGLVLVELVTNAFKHARSAEGNDTVDVDLSVQDAQLELSVRDYGVGLPEDFSFDQYGASLGMKVVTGMARQLDAELTWERCAPGTRWILTLSI